MPGFDLVRELFADEPCQINVLDVGAVEHEGVQAPAPYQPLVNAGIARVVGFEPDAAGCAKLNRRYGAPHVFLPYFIGEGGPATFYETNWGQTGSLFRPNRPLLEKFQGLPELVVPKAQHAVETRRLDDIPEVGDVDYLKIDVQGSELAVFRGGETALKKALVVHTEVEFVALYENQPLFGDVDCHLRSRGFQFHTLAEVQGRCFRPFLAGGDPYGAMHQILWADAVYVRDWMALDALSVAQLKKLAVILHEVLGSYDLCHLVVREIDQRSGTTIATRYLQAVTQGPASR